MPSPSQLIQSVPGVIIAGRVDVSGCVDIDCGEKGILELQDAEIVSVDMPIAGVTAPATIRCDRIHATTNSKLDVPARHNPVHILFERGVPHKIAYRAARHRFMGSVTGHAIM